MFDKNKLLNNKNLQAAWKIFPDSRLVGGAVRDLLIGNTPKDYDLTTSLIPEEVVNICKKENIQVIETGLSHGTVTAMINNEPFEITTLRKDIICDGRHAEVEWTSEWKEDAKRRDFTINAMYIDKDLNLYDYFGGREDIQTKTIRFVGNAEERIKEDSLRILRYFRFVNRYDSFNNIDDVSFKAVKKLINLTSNLSKERIHSEFTKIFDVKHNQKTFNIMNDINLLSVLFEGEKFNNIEEDFLNYYEFYAYVGKKIQKNGLISNYKLSKQEANIIDKIKMFNFNGDYFSINNLKDYTALKDYTLEDVETSLKFYKISYDKEIFNNFSIPSFPVTGYDIISKGFTQGIEIGKKNSFLKEKWKESGFSLSKEDLLKFLD